MTREELVKQYENSEITFSEYSERLYASALEDAARLCEDEGAREAVSVAEQIRALGKGKDAV